jgi:alpha-1,2-mannosyltransferase
MAAVTIERRGIWAAAGLLVAMAAYVKITPILLAIVWLWRGQRRAAYACAAALAGLWALSLVVHGLTLNLAYVDRVIQIGRASVLEMNNHSLPAFLGRFVLPPAELWQVQRLPPWLQSVTLASAAAILLLAVSRYPKGSAREDKALPAVESLAFVGMLLVPNVAWTHYFLFLLPGIGVLLSTTGPTARLVRTTGLVAFALCCRFVIPAQEYLPAMGAHVLSTAPTLAAALVAAALLWRPHAQAAVR